MTCRAAVSWQELHCQCGRGCLPNRASGPERATGLKAANQSCTLCFIQSFCQPTMYCQPAAMMLQSCWQDLGLATKSAPAAQMTAWFSPDQTASSAIAPSAKLLPQMGICPLSSTDMCPSHPPCSSCFKPNLQLCRCEPPCQIWTCSAMSGVRLLFACI